MSSRPKRVRQEPERLQQNNWRETETRKKTKTPARTQKPTGTKTPARTQNPTGTKTPGASKRKIQNVNIFNVLNSKNNNTKVFNMLYSIYKSTQKPKLSKTLSSLKNTTPEQFINEQFKILNKNVRSNGDKNTLNLKLSETDKLDFCLLIWLDMRHDAKASMKDDSFKNFLDSEDSPLKMIIKNPPAFQITDLMKNMKHFNIISEDFERPGPSNWERRIKDNLPELFGIKKPNKISSQSRYGFDIKNPINISIDSEGSKSAISMLIANNKTQVNNRSIRYPLRSIITIANRVDPGNTMPTGGVQQEWTKLFPNALNKSGNPDALDSSGNLKSTQLYNVSDCDFKIGDTKLELTSGTKGTFNMTVNGISIKVGSTAANVGPNIKNTLPPTENRGRFPAKAFYKIQKNKARVSKFLGDFMQILTVCSEPQKSRVTAFGTLDGVAAGIYTFISKRLMKQEPHLFIDMYLEQGNEIHVYGFSHLLNKNNNRLKPQQAQSVINTYKGNKGNTRNTASSGGGKTIRAASGISGNSTIRRNNGSNGNGTISGNSTNTNMGQPLRKNQKPSKTTLTVASAIRNNKNNNNNNNNNNNEVTSRSKKAKTTDTRPKFNMGTNPKNKKKSFFPFPVRRKVTPMNQSINAARAELNKLTSLRQNQKINYLEKMKQNPLNIIRILNNAKQRASTQRATRSQTPARTPK